MDFFRNERREELWLPDPEQNFWRSILIKSGIALLILVAVIVIIVKTHPSEEVTTARGVEMIRELESEKVADVEATIRGIREQWTEEEALEMEEQSSNLKQLFQNLSTLAMGDSILIATEDYGVLDSNTVIASNGASVGESEDALNAALNLGPWNFILAYGLDDVLTYGSNLEGFIQDFTKIVDTFHAMRPNASIYVCEITSVSQEALDKEPGYSRIADYNAALEELCLKKRMIFIHTQDLITDYAAGGILPSYDFFIPYATRMITTVQENKTAHTYEPDETEQE